MLHTHTQLIMCVCVCRGQPRALTIYAAYVARVIYVYDYVAVGSIRFRFRLLPLN